MKFNIMGLLKNGLDRVVGFFDKIASGAKKAPAAESSKVSRHIQEAQDAFTKILATQNEVDDYEIFLRIVGKWIELEQNQPCHTAAKVEEAKILKSLLGRFCRFLSEETRYCSLSSTMGRVVIQTEEYERQARTYAEELHEIIHAYEPTPA